MQPETKRKGAEKEKARKGGNAEKEKEEKSKKKIKGGGPQMSASYLHQNPLLPPLLPTLQMTLLPPSFLRVKESSVRQDGKTSKFSVT